MTSSTTETAATCQRPVRHPGRPAATSVPSLADPRLTYMDFGVWAVTVGSIKFWPSAAVIARRELRTGATYRVTRRPLRGLVELAID
ncbi:MAG TPA: hypothetical protein VIJ15_05760 [Dermatophilaceae bacterium]